MEINMFGGRKIKIRQLSKKDLTNVKQFQDFINSFIEENAQVTMNKKITLKEEKKWLKEKLENIKKEKVILLVAECNNLLVGTTEIWLGIWRQNHIGNLGITIKKNYRGIGLGSYLMKKIINLAKKKLKPRPKTIRLSVFSTNKPAIKLYKKCGFKIIARIPKQIKYKKKLIDEIIMIK